MQKLLDGVRILDFTHVHAGPLCTYQLALMGAAVLKVEAPGSGDQMRSMGHQFVPGMSAGFIGQNANKRSIAVDLKKPRGLEIVKSLIAQSDALVINMRPGTANRLGIGYEACKSLRPNIVYCAISGYGQSGPESDRPAFDHLMQGESGMFMATGTDEQPVRVGFAVADASTAIIASSAVAAALYRRSQSGEGAYLDVSMLECCMAVMGLNYYNYFATGIVNPRPGPNPMARTGSAGTWPTKDGFLLVNANNQRLFERMAHALDKAELVSDSRFGTPEDRVTNCDELRAIFGAVFLTDTAIYWDERLRDAGVPSGCLKTPPETVQHAQLKHRNSIAQMERIPGFESAVSMLGAGFLVDDQSVLPLHPPPLLGEHTKNVLTELTYSETEIQALFDDRIVA